MQMMLVDTAVTVPVNVAPLTDDTDFKSIEASVAYNAAGMALKWNFVTKAGVITQTAVTPTTAGVYDWTHVGGGMYKIEIPASGGGSINNDTEGYGYFSGVCDGVLPWRGPTIHFAPANIVNSLVDGSDYLDVNTAQIEGADPTDTILGALVDDATRIDASALNTLSSHDPGETIMGATDLGTGSGLTSLATAAALATAQSDLDTLTGLDGVTLATSQPNYAPSTHTAADVWAVATRVLTANTNLNDLSAADVAAAVWNAATATYGTAGSYGLLVETNLDDTVSSKATAAALATAQADLDTLTGTDGVTLATSQPNYAPSTHSAADVWTAGTRTLTAATNITSSGGTITTSGGIVQSQLADGVTHGGSTAKFRLGSTTSTPPFWVTASASTAALFSSSYAGSAAFQIYGSTNNHGLYISGHGAGKYAVYLDTSAGSNASIYGDIDGDLLGNINVTAGTITNFDGLDAAQDTQHATTQAALATAQADLDTITGADGVTLATTQGNYAPAKAGDEMDLVNAPNATAITAIQSGLATAASITALNDLDAGEVATAVWNAATATYGSAGSYGLLVETNLDAAVSSRSSHTAANVVSAMQAVASDFKADVSGLAMASALATAQSDLDILTGADGVTLATLQPNYAPYTGTPPTVSQIRSEIDSNSTQLAAIVADTGELQTDWADGGRLDLILDSRASQTSVDTVDTVVDAVLVDTGTTLPGLIGTPSVTLADDLAAVPTAAENAVGLLDYTDGVESSVTVRQSLRIMSAILAGIITTAGTGTEIFKGVGQSSGGTTRVTVTVDSSGNRSVVTLAA